ncbi:MAG: hypothetical protein ACREMR_07665, partial [Gemmatimonadales bacterium]
TPIKPFPIAACVPCARYAGGDEARYDGDEDPGADPILDARCRDDWDATRSVCRDCGGALQELIYLRYLTRCWQQCGALGAPSFHWASIFLGPVHPVLAIAKPRRMRMSWLLMSLHTWLCLFHPHAKVFVMSSKLEKSAELIERAEGILRRIPSTRMRLDPGVHWVRTGTVKGGLPMLEFQNAARLWGVAEGADQLRQYGATAVLCDEIGTWQHPRASYTAIKPTIEGGGQLTLVSSAYPGFWEELCTGSLTA